MPVVVQCRQIYSATGMSASTKYKALTTKIMRRRIPVPVLVSVRSQLVCWNAYTLGRERGKGAKEETRCGFELFNPLTTSGSWRRSQSDRSFTRSNARPFQWWSLSTLRGGHTTLCGRGDGVALAESQIRGIHFVAEQVSVAGRRGMRGGRNYW